MSKKIAVVDADADPAAPAASPFIKMRAEGTAALFQNLLIDHQQAYVRKTAAGIPYRFYRLPDSVISERPLRTMHMPKGDQAVQDAISAAERLCMKRGIRLTGLRREILEILARADGAIGAYSILDQLARARGKAVGPPTIYRTLEMLVSIGCVVKIESRNAFTLCDTPGHDHHGMMLICRRCGKADEIENADLDHLLQATVTSSGFHPERQIVEVEGLCEHCWAGP